MEGSSRRWHALRPEEVLELLGTDRGSGLTGEEAARRLEAGGRNVIAHGRGPSPLGLFLRQFQNTLVVILLLAVLVSTLLGELLDASVIALITVLAAAMGFAQEYRAERVFAALRERLSQSSLVLRDGKTAMVDSTEVVPGDLVLLGAGGKVPADVRLVEATALRINESALTGESVPAAKQTDPVAEGAAVHGRACMAYAGTVVTSGKGVGVTVATGEATEFGRIAEETAQAKEGPTPLEVQVELVGRRFGLVALAIILAVALAELVRGSLYGGLVLSGLVSILLFAIALGVAAVPEALPAVITATLAIGARSLARSNALVRKMSAVEALGSTEVLCFDKTGTLTRGEMTVRKVYADGATFDVSGGGYGPEGGVTLAGTPVGRGRPALERLGEGARSCNDSVLQTGPGGRWEVVGDPTEGALLVLAGKLGAGREGGAPRGAEVPFTPERKMMTTFHPLPGGGYVSYSKGAPESIVPLCATELAGDGEVPLGEEGRARVLGEAERLSASGMRVLAVASKRLPPPPPGWTPRIEHGLTFIGLVGMEDPLRDDAVRAVKAAASAGMRPVMITGDHGSTAVSIATKAGIIEGGGGVITGAELEGLGDAAFDERVEGVSVYARISPSDKLRIVRAWKRKRRVVAMTGDGVNDAPALKEADIGVAMGVSGTDVAKEAADIVLADDNFASMVRAVELGRWIYDNIRKYLAYLLQANLVEVAVLGSIALVLAPLLGLGDALPLLPVQILYLNLATDGLPALALGVTPPDPDLLQRPPRPKDEPVFSREFSYLVAATLVSQVPVLLLGFADALGGGMEGAQTRLFLMLVFMELALAVTSRSLRRSAVRVRPHRWLVLSVIWEGLLIAALVQFPWSRAALHVSVPTAADVYWVMAGVAVVFVVSELLKGFVLARRHRPRGAGATFSGQTNDSPR